MFTEYSKCIWTINSFFIYEFCCFFISCKEMHILSYLSDQYIQYHASKEVLCTYTNLLQVIKFYAYTLICKSIVITSFPVVWVFKQPPTWWRNPLATWWRNPLATWWRNPLATWWRNHLATWWRNPLATWWRKPPAGIQPAIRSSRSQRQRQRLTSPPVPLQQQWPLKHRSPPQHRYPLH